MLGYKHKKITCPKCGKSGGAPSMKRWHFDKCTGNRPFKSKASYNGKSVFLGMFETKELAYQNTIEFYKSVNKPLPKEFVKNYNKFKEGVM